MAERYWLDPSEVSTGRQELEITHWVDAEGVDWGDAAIEGYMADMARGSTAVDFRVPNRQIQIPLIIKAGPGTTTFNQARSLIQRKVARIQQEGGWIKRVTSSGAIVFADLVNATLKFGGSWYQANKNFDPDATLNFEAIPDWYGAEVQLADHVETTNGELIWTESNIPGDYPGRLRLVVDNDQAGAPQQGLLWGIRSRHYSTSTTAALKYEAETCTPLDSATVFGTTIRHPNLSTNWTPVMSTHQTGGIALTHTGTHRVWARAQAVATTTPRLRLLWDVGDFALPSENRPVRLPGINEMYVVDLGEVRLDRVPAGIHRWQGTIQAAGDAGGENVTIDKLWFQPVDEGAGVLRAPLNSEPGLAPFVARDEFNQTAGVLTGKTAPVGGTWAAAGATGDFVVEATGHWVQRTTVSDGARRLAVLPQTMTNMVVQAIVNPPQPTQVMQLGVVARFTNGLNYAYARIDPAVTAQNSSFVVGKIVAGVETWMMLPVYAPRVADNRLVRLMVDTAGRWFAWMTLPGGTPQLMGYGVDSQLATGGSLASGQPGFLDYNGTATGSIRAFENFAAWVPQQDAVLHPNQSAELRTEGMFREDPTGAAYGPVTWVEGDLPRIPASGSEGRSVQFFLKASRGDLSTLPDTAVDDISARVSYRPSFLFVS